MIRKGVKVCRYDLASSSYAVSRVQQSTHIYRLRTQIYTSRAHKYLYLKPTCKNVTRTAIQMLHDGRKNPRQRRHVCRLFCPLVAGEYDVHPTNISSMGSLSYLQIHTCSYHKVQMTDVTVTRRAAPRFERSPRGTATWILDSTALSPVISLAQK